MKGREKREMEGRKEERDTHISVASYTHPCRAGEPETKVRVLDWKSNPRPIGPQAGALTTVQSARAKDKIIIGLKNSWNQELRMLLGPYFLPHCPGKKTYLFVIFNLSL